MFLNKLDEARKEYKQLQQSGIEGVDLEMKRLDRLFLDNFDDSDPESPDECIFGHSQISQRYPITLMYPH